MAVRDTCRSALLLVLVSSLLYLASAKGNTLVLLDNANTKETHSIFFNSLRGECYGISNHKVDATIDRVSFDTESDRDVIQFV